MPVTAECLLSICVPSHLLRRHKNIFALDCKLAQFCARFMLRFTGKARRHFVSRKNAKMQRIV